MERMLKSCPRTAILGGLAVAFVTVVHVVRVGAAVYVAVARGP